MMTELSETRATSALAVEVKERRRTVHLGGLAVPGATVGAQVTGWELHLRARNLSAHTIRRYVGQVRRFADWCGRREPPEPDVLPRITRAQVERYLADALAHGRSSSVKAYHGALYVFFQWCVAEGELKVNPMAGLRTPLVPESPPPLLTDDDLRALLRLCEGADFLARRDTAILRLLIDTGMRRGELAGLRVGDLDLQRREATVLGKGRRTRTVVYGHQAALALSRYLRIREQHPDAGTGALWLGRLGPMTDNGLYKVVVRLGRQAGLGADIWPHLLRHTWAHTTLADGMQEGDLMELAGWRSPLMVRRYGAALRSERARDAARKHQLGDRL